MESRTKLIALLLAAALSGCATPSGGVHAALVPQAAVQTIAPKAVSPIRHIVIVVQENRSFENIFAGYPGADAPMTGKMSNGKTVELHPIPLVTTDVCHSFSAGFRDYDGGKMDGFDGNCTGHGPSGTFDYAYIRRDLAEPYWSMARQYTLADRMFATMMGPSFTAHLTLVAGTASLNPHKTLIDIPSASPWGCDAPPGTRTDTYDVSGVTDLNGPFPCVTAFRTMADTLDAAHVSWRYYVAPLGSSNWTAFDAIRNVRFSPDWKRSVIGPPPQFLRDVAHGTLANVTWVVPEYPYSDHAPGGNLGPSWVAAVVNAVGRSAFWKSSAIVVLWDDWGGWYDDAVPPQIDYRGLGLRVPCIIIGPYAKRHYVSHTQYEFGSILKFVEDQFGLPALGPAAQGYTDARATSIGDSFDFTKPPHAFKEIAAPVPPSVFLRMPDSPIPPDDE